MAAAQLGFKRRAKIEHGSSAASETGVKQLEKTEKLQKWDVSEHHEKICAIMHVNE